jgi:hypothetical protein
VFGVWVGNNNNKLGFGKNLLIYLDINTFEKTENLCQAKYFYLIRIKNLFTIDIMQDYGPALHLSFVLSMSS